MSKYLFISEKKNQVWQVYVQIFISFRKKQVWQVYVQKFINLFQKKTSLAGLCPNIYLFISEKNKFSDPKLNISEF